MAPSWRIHFANAGAKVDVFWVKKKFFPVFLLLFQKNAVILPRKYEKQCICFRKVAQLVAHYVRDVGVGRSSRLFPTTQADGSLPVLVPPEAHTL